MDDRVPEHRDSHASSSHEPSWEPMRSADLGKHSVYTHFPKDRNCESCQRTKITRAPCRRRIGTVVPRAQNFWWFDYSRSTKFSVKGVNLEAIIDVQSWCKSWLPNGSSLIRSKKKLLRKHKGACKSSWSRTGSPKPFALTVPWNLAKRVKIFPGIIVHRHHTDRKQMGLLKEQCAGVKEGTSAVLLQSRMDEQWWAHSMECSAYLRNIQDLLSERKTPCERLFGEPLDGPIIPFGSLVEYYPVLRKTSQESISLERKSCLDYSLDTFLRGANLEGWHFGCRLLRSWKRWTHLKSTRKDSMRKEVIFPKENRKFIIPVADGRIKFVGGGQELRTSTLIPDHPIRGEDQSYF